MIALSWLATRFLAIGPAFRRSLDDHSVRLQIPGDGGTFREPKTSTKVFAAGGRLETDA